MLTKSKPPSYRFCLNSLKSPTYANLSHYLQEQSWHKTRFNSLAHFSEKNFQFNASAAEQLEFKDLLANLTQKYCPEYMPLTYCINDGNWQTILNQVADRFYTRNSTVLDQVDHLVWILKPAQLNNGHHIKIFQRLSQIEQHYFSSNRVGGSHVLQQYITQPHLLQGPSEGHKYSIRMFVVLTNYAGAYLYPEGYFNVALNPYQANDFTKINTHLTNEHLKENELNVIQIPTQQFKLFQIFYPQIKAIVTGIIHALRQQHSPAFICNQLKKLAIFGFDFMVDAQERVWLLEANHGPCFPTDAGHPLYVSLYQPFWQAFIERFVMEIAGEAPLDRHYRLFDWIES
jgi:tubulin--tyrosine ligase